MKFRIEIETDGAAFEDTTAEEIARILWDLAERIEGSGTSAARKVYDVNGNVCGTVTYE